MLRQPTLDLLHELRLAGMARAFEEQTAMPDIAELSFEDRLSLLLEREKAEREQRRYQRLKGHAGSTSTPPSKTSTSRHPADSTDPSCSGSPPASGSGTARPSSSPAPPDPASPTSPAHSATKPAATANRVRSALLRWAERSPHWIGCRWAAAGPTCVEGPSHPIPWKPAGKGSPDPTHPDAPRWSDLRWKVFKRSSGQWLLRWRRRPARSWLPWWRSGSVTELAACG